MSFRQKYFGLASSIAKRKKANRRMIILGFVKVGTNKFLCRMTLSDCISQKLAFFNGLRHRAVQHEKMGLFYS
jgi:hypothetical protein